MPGKRIIFIHGMYMNHLCWEHWIGYFQNSGYQCIAPAWPGRDQPVEVLRLRHPDPSTGKLTLKKVVEHFTSIVNGLDEKPILVGHSMGGLVVQLLLQKNLAVAGVAIDSAPPMGVITAQWSFINSNWPHISPFASQGNPIAMSFERFQDTFVNTMPLSDQREAYDKYVVPESRRIPREALSTKIDYKLPHPPLLFIAGGADHLIPAPLNKSNHAKYQRSTSVTDYKEFPGRVHFTIGQKGWEDVAGFVKSWLAEQKL
jgi:pimeloyl-ACP methyl ester carboxylesterase